MKLHGSLGSFLRKSLSWLQIVRAVDSDPLQVEKDKCGARFLLQIFSGTDSVLCCLLVASSWLLPVDLASSQNLTLSGTFT